MQKAIVPTTSLPPITSNGLYYVRYRITSEDKTSISDWSRVYPVYGKLVKDIIGANDGVDLFVEAVSTGSGTSQKNGMSISWNLPEELQNSTYDVFIKWSEDDEETYTENWILVSTVKVNTAYVSTPAGATHIKARIQIETWDKKTSIDDVEIGFDSESTSNNYVLVAQSSEGVSTKARVDNGTL